ncbi:MAG: metallophosphoesterase, partial [Ignavibacteriaceae bacterium]|nr:metallophosphoesterase [Ignavibacteriaceae bacterium]
MKTEINVLHLSDIHFGYETDQDTTLIAQRENVLNALIDRLKQIEPKWKPDIVVISGDIGWKGITENYKPAKEWISSLLQILNLSPKELLVCPGNHDINRDKTVGMDYTDSITKADSWLKVEKLESFERLFNSFTEFCREIRIPTFKIADKESYLVGVRELLGLRFVVLNSAWFCRGDEDKNKLWIGLPQLELMNSKKQLLNETNYDDENILLAIMHHPDNWLNANEINSYGGRPNTYNYLAERSHIILSGHVHGEIKRPNRMAIRAYLFTAGATYANKYYRNNFSILKIETKDRILTRKSYEYNPPDTNWKEISDPENYYLRKDESPIKSANSPKDGYDYKNLIIKSKEQIQRFIENKSKAIARTRKLPELIERKIVWHSQEERIIPDGKGKIQLNAKNNISTLSEMTSTERPTFVFGELGSGKSTLVGQYLINLADNLNGILPLLIPASFFNGKEIKLVTDLERLINEFVNGQIIPTYKDFEIFRALQHKIEITLIIDGFDELSRIEAQNLLTKAEELRDSWAGLRIIATGRPIELAGLNYSNWQCLEMFPITNSELNEILLNEAIANGLDKDQAVEDSKKRIHFLNERPELLGITTTPLSIRLIRPCLTEEIKRKSLGDLIYDIIIERLGAWDIKDSKETHFDEFKKFYPNPLSRKTLLGVIAREIIESNNRTVTEEQLNTVLKNVTPKESKQNIIVEQTVNFFEKCILQKEIDHFVFPTQPILQGALGIYIYEQLLNAKDVNFKVGKTDLWREYSFAATMARRENNIKTIRSGLVKFIDDIFLDENFIPAIAIIVSEAEDEELAKHFIELLKKLDFRPLRYFQDIKTQSVRAIAHTIYLAGDLGFDWFYEEYLNPIYPSGIHYDDEQYLILQHWFTFCNYKLTSKQQEQLTLILNPHLVAMDWSCHKLPETLVMVLPQLFPQDKEFLMYVANIESTLFGRIVVDKLKNEFKTGNSEKVINALINYIARNENPKLSVIKLWFELTDKFPPKEIITSTILRSIDENNLEVFEELIKRIGEDNLKSVLRFYLFLDSKIAAASAICLYRLGERDFYPLATGLLQGLHDGGKIQEAEKVLHELIANKGIQGLTWLANKFYDCDPTYGAHSAYWCILLTELNKISQVDVNIFAKAVANLGEFILPRYPEIRVELKKLLTSKADYRDFLNRSLRSINKKIRYNSACMLLACFPESEAKACEIIINSTTVYYEKHEWWRFCLRLSLGKEVIANTVSIINKLLPIPRTFALTLLYHNNYSLSSELFEQLISGLISRRARFDADYSLQSDNLKKILAQNESWELLNKYLHNSNIDIARNAADALLLYHKEKLSDCEYGISWGLSIAEMFTWKKERIDKEIIQLKQNEERFNNIKKILDKTHKETN